MWGGRGGGGRGEGDEQVEKGATSDEWLEYSGNILASTLIRTVAIV